MMFVDRDLARRFERAEGHGAPNGLDARLCMASDGAAARKEAAK